jgi:hypothetical protein
VDDTGQFPLGMAAASGNDDLTLALSGDRYLAFLNEALVRFQKLSNGRLALARGDYAGGIATLQALTAELISSFQRGSADLARFRAGLQSSMWQGSGRCGAQTQTDARWRTATQATLSCKRW